MLMTPRIPLPAQRRGRGRAWRMSSVKVPVQRHTAHIGDNGSNKTFPCRRVQQRRRKRRRIVLHRYLDGLKFSAVRRLCWRLLDQSKNAVYLHRLHWGPRWGWSNRNFVEIFCTTKLVPGLSRSIVCMILCLVVLIQYRRVTDGQRVTIVLA